MFVHSLGCSPQVYSYLNMDLGYYFSISVTRYTSLSAEHTNNPTRQSTYDSVNTTNLQLVSDYESCTQIIYPIMATHPRCWIYCTKYLLHQVIIGYNDILPASNIYTQVFITRYNILLLVCDLKQQLIGLGDRCNYRTPIIIR